MCKYEMNWQTVRFSDCDSFLNCCTMSGMPLGLLSCTAVLLQEQTAVVPSPALCAACLPAELVGRFGSQWGGTQDASVMLENEIRYTQLSERDRTAPGVMLFSSQLCWFLHSGTPPSYCVCVFFSLSLMQELPRNCCWNFLSLPHP